MAACELPAYRFAIRKLKGAKLSAHRRYLGVEQIAEIVGAASIADAEGILQAFVTRAVARRQTPVTVRAEDVQRAVGLVSGTA